jgi:hypothetical protein
MVYGLGFRDKGLGYWVEELGSRVITFGLSGSRVEGFRGLGFRV